MKRRYVLAIPLLVGATLGIVHLLPGDAAAPPVSAGMTAATTAARAEAASRRAKLPPLQPHAPVGRFSAESIQAADEAFRSMTTVRGLVIQDQERRALAQSILARPDGAALMREILLDPAFARSAFGDFQAEARFYAIAVLKEAARQGNVDVVADTTAGLVSQLAGTGGEPDRGRSEDLMGVAAIIGENVGSHGLPDARAPMLARLGCTTDLAMSVRVLCLRGLFQGVWAADGLEEAQAMVERVRTL